MTFVTFVTFCYMCVESRGSRGLVFVFFVICCCGGGLLFVTEVTFVTCVGALEVLEACVC